VNRGEAYRQNSGLHGLRELIAKRMDEGMSPIQISRRVGVSYQSVLAVCTDIRKEREMANGKEKLAEVKPDVEKMVEDLKEKITKTLRNSLQTHQAQDIRRELIEDLEALEQAIRQG
jgi:hypothetical protein